MSSFQKLGLNPWLCMLCEEMGYKEPSEVQRTVIPDILAGHDVVACAKTGTGKTAAFALPLVHELSLEPFGIFAVVLTPSRELAHQIGEQFRAFGAPMRLRALVCTGGDGRLEHTTALDERPHVLVATPGRLADLLRLDARAFRRVRCLVLDEADRLLRQGGADEPHVAEALRALPLARRNLLFSATLTPALRALGGKARVHLPEALREQWSESDAGDQGKKEKEKEKDNDKEKKAEEKPRTVSTLADGLQPFYLRVGRGTREIALFGVLRELLSRVRSVLLFFRGRRAAEVAVEALALLGLDCVGLHAGMLQGDRLRALQSFRAERVRLLVATELAARGLDVPAVDAVVNAEVPDSTEAYVHRVGRTARAGRPGLAVTLVAEDQVKALRLIAEETGKMPEPWLGDPKAPELQAAEAKNVAAAFAAAAAAVENRDAERELRNDPNSLYGNGMLGALPADADEATPARKKRKTNEKKKKKKNGE